MEASINAITHHSTRFGFASRVTSGVMSKNKKYKTIILSALALMIPLNISAQNMADWRTPTKSELADDIGWRTEDSNRYLVAIADFDGDGKQDKASLLINDSTFAHPIVCLYI